MKEAAGEANMTVITIVLIGVVAGVGLLLVPRLMQNAKAKACCTDAGWFVSGNRCCDPTRVDSKCNSSNGVGYWTMSNSGFASAEPFKECMK